MNDEDDSAGTANTEISMMDLEQASNVAVIIENANYHGLGMEVDSILQADQPETDGDEWDHIKEPALGDTLY